LSAGEYWIEDWSAERGKWIRHHFYCSTDEEFEATLALIGYVKTDTMRCSADDRRKPYTRPLPKFRGALHSCPE
jgi:hypothetical protein